MPNAEDVNNRVKLFFHRLIARRIGQDPSLLDVARRTLARQRERADLDCYDEWDRLLRLDVATLRQVIIRRDERMTRLRSSSPLAGVIDMRDPELRRRIWRASRRALEKRDCRAHRLHE